MSLHDDLLAQAKALAVMEPRRPLQASLRRAVSTAYYALFHFLVDEATRRMLGVGADRELLRGCLARAFNHSNMKKVAVQFSKSGVSTSLAPGLNGLAVQRGLKVVAETFAELQYVRHQADYDPTRRFTRSEVLRVLDRTGAAFGAWRRVRRTPQADTFLVGLLAFGNMRS